MQLHRPVQNVVLPRFGIRHFGVSSIPFLPQVGFRFTDICPDVFRWIRDLCGVSCSVSSNHHNTSVFSLSFRIILISFRNIAIQFAELIFHSLNSIVIRKVEIFFFSLGTANT